MKVTPAIRADCWRIVSRINRADLNPNRKHLEFAVFVGNYSVQAIRRKTDHCENMMEKHPDRLVGVYGPGVTFETICESVAEVSVRNQKLVEDAE